MPASTVQALEQALVANPNDLAAHASYARHLIDQGDPRGEFIQVQLALEDASLAASERERLAARERELIDRHQADWLGSLADRDDLDVRFARGWIDRIQMPSMREDLASLLAAAPELRLLRELAVIDPCAPSLDRRHAWNEVMLMGATIFSDEESAALEPLMEAEVLGNLRVLRLGDPDHERCDVGPGPLLQVLSRLPRLETLDVFLWELNTTQFFAVDCLPQLKCLRVGGAFMYDVEVLAANTRLPELRELYLEASSGHGSVDMVWMAGGIFPFPHQSRLERLSLRFMRGLADDCEELASSGLLRRLRDLDVQYSALTDDAADRLAACPDFTRLDRLDIGFNHLSDAALDRLCRTGVNVVSAEQIPPMSDDFEELMNEE